MNVDEAWERFEAKRDEQFKRSSALGTMDVMQAQLNELKANTEEIKQKIEELAAEKEETPAPAPAPAPDMGGAPEGIMPDMGAAPGGEEAGAEEGDQTMDETGAPGETGQDMMPPSQPPADTGGEMGGGVPQMTDEDLDMLFGGAENKNEEGTEEAGEEETQDPTLKALQDAISAATDEKVIADLARMIVEYTGGGDSEGEEKVLAGLPDGTPLEGVSEEAVTEELFRSESFEKGKAGAVSDTAAPAAPKPQVAETAKLADESAEKDGVPSGDTAVKTENSVKFGAGGEGGPIESGDPGAGSAPMNASEPDEGEKKEDEEEEKEESDEKKDEPEESESEDADEADKEPEAVEVKETIVEEEPEVEDGKIAISDLMDMSLGDLVDLVKDGVEVPADDANVFVNGEGEKSIPFTNCNPIKRSVDDLIRERESTMVGVDGKKYQFTKSGKNARSVDMLNRDLHNYDKIRGMKTGEVLSAFRFMKSIGVRDVETDNMDALDVIVRGLDSKIGSANTDAFMKSAGFDLDAIYKSTEIKKSEEVQGGKHIKTLAETGSMDIKKSGDATMDVPRAADAGKAYVSPQDLKARLGSIDDLIAGRMKG